MSCSTVAELIEESREALRWSPVQLLGAVSSACTELGIEPPDPSTVYRWRTNTRIPGDDYRLALAKALGWGELQLAQAQRLAGEHAVARGAV